MRELHEKTFALSGWETSSMSIDEASTARARDIFTIRRCVDAKDLVQAIPWQGEELGTAYVQGGRSQSSVTFAGFIALAQPGVRNVGVAMWTCVPQTPVCMAAGSTWIDSTLRGELCPK
eukprot:3943143-Amphidinium_carterae.1